MLLRARNSGNFLPSVFDEFFNNAREESDVSFSKPDFNVYETEKEFIVEAAVPGLEKKDFNIEVDNNVLNISAEIEKKNEEADKKYYYRGFCYGSFKKSYSLPEDVKSDDISAKYENGILKINIPKAKEVKVSRQVKIG